MKTIIQSFLTFLCLWIIGFKVQAVSPPPDGGYPGGNTAEGDNALLSLSSGLYNTGVGLDALLSITGGNFCTAVGAGTLLVNTADNNTATGAGALFSSTTGGFNTANGTFALFSNKDGNGNTGVGFSALQHNINGHGNAAVGDQALFSNTTGFQNTAIGHAAGDLQTTGSNNVYIGVGMGGVAGENNACYIASIFGQMVNMASATGVLVDANGKLGTTLSSRRFKHDIKPMDNDSQVIFLLQPVTFHYKSDARNTPCFGLIAEEVADVKPDLVVRDKEGKPNTVRYDQINAMLLNEFLKEHRKVEQVTRNFESKLAEQQKQIEALTEGLQKVSAQLEANKPVPQVAENNH